MNNVIYCFTFPNNKRYIGKTEKRFSIRLSSHKYRAKYSKNYLYNAIRYYKWENIKIEILYVCKNKEELNLKEIEYILLYETTDPQKGYNLRTGGEGGLHNKITKEKISLKNKGINNPMFGKHSWNKGKSLSKEHIEKLRISHIGQTPWNKGVCGYKTKPCTQETKEKISAKNSCDNNGMSKLNCDIIKEIRNKYKTNKYTQKELAIMYNINQQRINWIVNYKAWSKCEF